MYRFGSNQVDLCVEIRYHDMQDEHIMLHFYKHISWPSAKFQRFSNITRITSLMIRFESLSKRFQLIRI